MEDEKGCLAWSTTWFPRKHGLQYYLGAKFRMTAKSIFLALKRLLVREAEDVFQQAADRREQ